MTTTTSSSLIKGYENFYGLRESPFKLTPDTRYLVSLSDHNNAYNMLMYALESGEGFMKITGEVGLGKTMLCRRLLKELGNNHVTLYIPNPRLTPYAIKKAIANELGLSPKREDAASLLMRINQKLVQIGKSNKSVILLIDESQNIPSDTLEEIRMISNLETEQRKLIQIIFFGQLELNDLLAKKEHRQLKQRIGFSYELKPLDYNGVYTYIVSRMRHAGFKGPTPFTFWALRGLKKSSMGSPRLLNILCHKVLLLGYAKNKSHIGRSEVMRAAEDTESAKKPFLNVYWYWLIPITLTPVVVLASRWLG